MSIDLAVQKAIRNRLVTTPAVIALVPATSILDRNQRPAPSPSIVLGESQAVDEGSSLRRQHVRIFHTVHVWMQEAALEGVKTIAGAIRAAINAGKLELAAGFHCADVYVASQRFLRDPDGETSHGVVTIEILVGEEA